MTINDRDIYHIETQMTEDEEITFLPFLLLKLRKKMEKIRSKEMEDIVEKHKSLIKEKDLCLKSQAQRIRELEQQLEKVQNKSC